MSAARRELIYRLEERFRHLTTVLYDTSVPPAQVDEEIHPYLDEGVRFVDPWQTESGVKKYRLGLAGFHSMFKFHFDILQLNVTLDEGARTGRCIVDGIMYLKQLHPVHTYPLRTILTYAFDVTDPGSAKKPVRFKIRHHEEMWSWGDMIAALPLVGWAYSKLFRPVFARGFLAASWLSSRAKGFTPR